MTRRRLVAGVAATLAAGVAARPARAVPVAECFDPGLLAGSALERQAHRPTAADAVAEPPLAPRGNPVTGALSGVIRRVDVPPGDKPVALTFDLCQTRGSIAGYDGAIIAYLKEQSVPATLFPGGLWLATHRARAIELVSDPLFLLGNHSWTHHDLHSAPAETIDAEIRSTESELDAVRHAERAACSGFAGASRPARRLFRFPFGSCSPEGVAAANAAGSVVIQWDVVSGDPDGTLAATIERNVLSRVRAGSVVVMHANGRGTHTAQALTAIIPKLRADGYRFVRVDELLAAGRPQAATACYIERPGDTVRYDNGTARHRPAALEPSGPS